ncbi:HAMP domain-containing sensor histidine kinase [Fulvivirgaceae bacterium BMA12]|uniref:histidine kinase n=1 Tax=Agaribacillus aureus TaxID=3051825 RepID=A0ABT8L013_9BACT|nr:HAMP domain-containing sensor histidine kinase [Fulvivirgaceae bacterium BMA12]
MFKPKNESFNFDGTKILTASNKEKKIRVLLVIQLIKLIIIGLIVSSVVDTFLGIYEEVIATLITLAIFLFILFFVDKARYYNTTVTLSIFFLCTLIFYSDAKYGLPAGVFILFLPTAFAISFVTNYNSFYCLLHFGIPIGYLILSIYTDHSLFLDPSINAFQKKVTLIFNLCLSTVLFALFIYYIHKINNKYEKGISKAIQKLKFRNKEQINLNHQLDQLLAVVSHELRGPIASVLSLIKIVKEEKDPDKVAEYIDLEEKSLIKLNEFIEDIINYSRNTNLTLEKESINFEQIVQSILSQYNFEDKYSSIKTHVNIHQGEAFTSDKKRIQIILSNLIANAFKYHDPQKNNPYVRIDVIVADHEAKITVNDNGKGIQRHHLNRVFDMFYRANEKISGSGLGLYLVKETVEKLGGNIVATSTIDKESSFEIALPDLAFVRGQPKIQ